MSIIVHLLIATALVTGLILLRLFTERLSLRAKMLRGQSDDCNTEECISCALKTTR